MSRYRANTTTKKKTLPALLRSKHVAEHTRLTHAVPDLLLSRNRSGTE